MTALRAMQASRRARLETARGWLVLAIRARLRKDRRHAAADLESAAQIRRTLVRRETA